MNHETVDGPADTTVDDTIDLREAADLAGVHYQTIYRWVRSGRLPAVLVAGKYRVERSALDSAMSVRAAPAEPMPPSADRVRRQAEPMHAALSAGDEGAARRLARQLVAEGTSVVDLVQDVLAPPLRRIGQDWHDGKLPIWVEHRASAMVERMLAELVGSRRGRRRGTALVAAVSGDRHSLPTSMAAAALRDANWRVHHLGADMPPEELVQFCAEHVIDVAVLSSTNPSVAEVAAEAAASLEASGTPVVLGRPGATLDELLEQVAANAAR
ncbi:MAG: B12-binding domain-containing protein [Actinomycetota bacterium]